MTWHWKKTKKKNTKFDNDSNRKQKVRFRVTLSKCTKELEKRTAGTQTKEKHFPTVFVGVCDEITA